MNAQTIDPERWSVPAFEVLQAGERDRLPGHLRKWVKVFSALTSGFELFDRVVQNLDFLTGLCRFTILAYKKRLFQACNFTLLDISLAV
jgi:hypothetical protein